MIRIRHIAALVALCSLPVLCLAQAEKPAADKSGASPPNRARMRGSA